MRPVNNFSVIFPYDLNHSQASSEICFLFVSGNVVAQLQSNGGMATWDGCNSDGSRVKSGVYFVLASENEDETSNAVVAKFLIIR